MPLPAPVDRVRAELADLYRDAQQSMEQRLAAIAADPAAARTAVLRQRLAGLALDVNRLAADLDEQAAAWLENRFPLIYEAGADTAGGARWTQIHVEAVTELALDTHQDLLAATRYMRRDVKALIREATRAASRAAIVEGDTARQAGRSLAQALTDRGVAAVRYRNGARVGIGDYGEMVVRTKTAVAYNAGTINAGIAAGVKWFECFDGPDCGLAGHDDPEKANGGIYPASIAQANSIAHPNCARSWGARPDLGTGRAGTTSTTPATSAPQAPVTARRAQRLEQRQQRLAARSAR